MYVKQFRMWFSLRRREKESRIKLVLNTTENREEKEEASDGAKYGRDGREAASGPFPPKMEQTDVPKKEGAAAPSVPPLFFWQEMVWSKLQQGEKK